MCITDRSSYASEHPDLKRTHEETKKPGSTAQGSRILQALANRVKMTLLLFGGGGETCILVITSRFVEIKLTGKSLPSRTITVCESQSTIESRSSILRTRRSKSRRLLRSDFLTIYRKSLCSGHPDRAKPTFEIFDSSS